MSKKVALITVHGMGRTEPDYYRDLEDEVRERLGGDSDKVAVEAVYYQDILQENQDALWDKVRPHVDWRKLRGFLLFGFSDAASLEARDSSSGITGKKGQSAYDKAQLRISEALARAHTAMKGKGPIVVLAQSLGCQVISNYAWDAQQPKKPRYGYFKKPPECGAAKDAVRRLSTMSALITTGCNIPIFVAGHAKVVPFKKPNEDFRWTNFYDEDDVLGWPLAPLSNEYGELVEDVTINVGNLFMSWNPLSHTAYWEDDDVIEKVVEELRRAAK